MELSSQFHARAALTRRNVAPLFAGPQKITNRRSNVKLLNTGHFVVHLTAALYFVSMCYRVFVCSLSPAAVTVFVGWCKLSAQRSRHTWVQDKIKATPCIKGIFRIMTVYFFWKPKLIIMYFSWYIGFSFLFIVVVIVTESWTRIVHNSYKCSDVTRSVQTYKS